MEKKRNGENQNKPYRSGRFYSVTNNWYFSVRETKDQGPYTSRIDAEKNLEMYILCIKHFKKDKVKQNYLSLV